MTDETTDKQAGKGTDSTRASVNWQRYEYARQRGHRLYCDQARKCERMYLGGGKQWDEQVKDAMGGRPTYEQNEIMPAVNSAIGYQIHNRMDIGFLPRGGDADDEKAKIFQKVAMQVADANKLRWTETQVYSDGLIQQRGYFDIRMDFDSNIAGDIVITDLDPMDVLPDPDARTYDPDEGWHDFQVTRWLTYDEVEQLYGKAARAKIESLNLNDPAPGDADEDTERNHFGDGLTGTQYDAFYADGLVKRVRVIDRQYVQYEMAKVLVNLNTGDVKLAEPLTPDVLSKHLMSGEWIGSKRMMKRVYWLVTTRDVVLHDAASPYPWFTIVPYFAYFRRGVTSGMVDNAISPQEMLNKSLSSAAHIVNSAANSGWTAEENSLANMDEEDLEENGAETGLVLVYRKGSTPPKKIEPSQIPTGVDRLIERSTMAVKNVTVPDAMRGTPGQEISGVAIQSRQFASQQELALVLDNLGRTRHMLAAKLFWCIQNFMTDHRILRITETDPTTLRQKTVQLPINEPQPDGTFLNDMTEGDYNVVITEVPMQVTFENSQFQQAIEMRDKGVRIPDQFVVKHSNLADKSDILEAMAQTSPPDPLTQAKIDLTQAQALLAKATATTKKLEAMYDATTGATLVAANPTIAPLADEMLASSGFVDENAPPMIPGAVPGAPPQPVARGAVVPTNTHPNLPPNADVGMKRGIEQPANQGA